MKIKRILLPTDTLQAVCCFLRLPAKRGYYLAGFSPPSPTPLPSAYRFQAYQTSFRKETSVAKSRLFSQTTERNLRVIYLWDNTVVSIAVFLHCSRYKVCRHFEVVGCCRIVAFLTHQCHMIWNRASIRPRDPTDHRQLKRI